MIKTPKQKLDKGDKK